MLSWNKGRGEAIITTGIGHGKTDLAAFDSAELNAGIIDVNALAITSFIPPYWKLFSDKKRIERKTGKGRFLPMAFKYATSKTNPVSAAVAIGIPEKKTDPRIIMEYSSTEYNSVELEKLATHAVEEVFEVRGRGIDNILSHSVENHPKKGLYASALAAVVFFPEGD
ncbi:hypothetical protein K8R43_01915 [archaeon]|nr:hypothetical protein [archaeon]